MEYFIYAVAVLLLIAVALFIKVALFDKRPQKLGLLFALLSVPLFMAYYADRWPSGWGELPMRQMVGALDNLDGANTNFRSDIAPAFIIAILLLVHLTVLQRVAAGKRLERLQDPIATSFASALVGALAGGILVSTFAWGWVGAVIVGTVYALVYLGVLALLAAIIEIVVALAVLIGVWLKRGAFTVATWITRVASFVSSLSGRLGLTSLADRIRAQTSEQEVQFGVQQDRQDKELYEAFLRDRASQRRMSGRSEAEVAAELEGLSLPEEVAPPRPRESMELDSPKDAPAGA